MGLSCMPPEHALKIDSKIYIYSHGPAISRYNKQNCCQKISKGNVSVVIAPVITSELNYGNNRVRVHTVFFLPISTAPNLHPPSVTANSFLELVLKFTRREREKVHKDKNKDWGCEPHGWEVFYNKFSFPGYVVIDFDLTSEVGIPLSLKKNLWPWLLPFCG